MNVTKSLVMTSALSLIFYTKVSAEALQRITSYQTTISKNDRQSSTGASLKSIADILRQDRANVHEYGNPDRDAVDMFFVAQKLRSKIPEMLKHGSISPDVITEILAGRQLKIQVSVFILSDGAFSMVVATPAHNPEKPYEPAAGSAERKSIMDAMRAPVAKYTGSRPVFTGTVAVAENWAKFDGHTTPEKGKAFRDEVSGETELDFLAILQMKNGSWVCKYFAWAGDISASEDAREKFPECPKSLLPDLTIQP